MSLRRPSGRFDRRRAAWLIGALALLGAGAPAGAQTPGTDCECERSGEYVAPDPGVKPPLASALTGLSPHGRFRVVVTSAPGAPLASLDIVRVSDGTVLLHDVEGLQWAFSPDDDRFVIGFFTGSPPNLQFEYSLYDLTGGVPAPRIWRNGPTPWSSARIRFSDDGAVFLFAGHNATVGTSLTLLEVESGSLYETSFFASSPPQDLDDDGDPSVAGWGFGPDPTRFWYGWNANAAQGLTVGVRVNVATGTDRDETFTADSLAPFFSPCGDTFAYVVKQLALPDLTDVTLYETLDPLAAPLGSTNLPFSALEVHATATQHHVLQGGTPHFLAANRASDACPVPANDPPEAAFDPPFDGVAGSPASFTDESSDSDGQVVSWLWSFGDGATSSAQSPSHTYAVPGSYRVRLTVTDDDGDTDFVERDVRVCGSLASLSGRLLYQDDQDLYVLNASDGSTVRLTNAANSYSQVRGGRFSPDGTEIVYEERGYFIAGIWVMNADGSGRRRLSDGGGSNGLYEFHSRPAWSRDGQWIVFVSSDVETPSNRGFWIMRADGSAQAKIPNTAFLDFEPTFAPEISPACAPLPPSERTPDCYSIVFERSAGGSVRIAEIGGTGNGLAFLSPAGSFNSLRLSPDGTAFLYSKFLGLFGPIGGVHRVFTSTNPVGAETQITSGGDDVFWYPAWSPDGDAIAYSFSVDGIQGSVTNLEIGVSDGSGCSSRVLHSASGHQNVEDWATGHATQALGSVAGHVGLGSSILLSVPNAVVELTGDHHAITTADANGDFVFENVPIGASFTIRFVSAPGYIPFPSLPPTFSNFVGSAVAVPVVADYATATLTGAVRSESFTPIPDVTVTAVGEGESLASITGENGAYSMTIQNFGSYTVTPSKPGFRFEPPFVSGTLGTMSLDFTAIPLPPPGLIAFVSSRTGDEDIWIADADGAGAWDLTERSGSQRDPAWAPDGRRIAYASDERGAGFELWIHDLDTEELVDLETFGREPAWSPDGSELVFASDLGLRRLVLATGDVTDLTSLPTDASPAWRPDGTAIVFERVVEDGTTDLVELHLAFGFANPIVTYPGDDLDPAFAAVGEGFAHATQYAGQTTILAAWPLESYLSAAGENPSWSQDGNQVAYDHDGSIHRIDPRSYEFRTISDSGSDRDPSWQPSGITACANGEDDDFDGFVDLADSGCANEADASEQTDAPGCDNGIDDDGDGFTDAEDPGCPFPFAPYEDPLCDNGIDDDGDGATDFADDICSAGWPYQERGCGLGAELVLVIAAIRMRVRSV